MKLSVDKKEYLMVSTMPAYEILKVNTGELAYEFTNLSAAEAKWNMEVPIESAITFNKDSFKVVQNAMTRGKVPVVFCHSWCTLDARAVKVRRSSLTSFSTHIN